MVLILGRVQFYSILLIFIRAPAEKNNIKSRDCPSLLHIRCRDVTILTISKLRKALKDPTLKSSFFGGIHIFAVMSSLDVLNLYNAPISQNIS